MFEIDPSFIVLRFAVNKKKKKQKLHSRSTFQTHAGMTAALRKAPKPSINGHPTATTLINSLAKAYNVNHTQDWYKITHEQVKQLQGGKELLRHYNGSLSRALVDIFPLVDWKMWRFENHKVPAHFWDDTNNQKKFFDDFAQEMNIQKMEQVDLDNLINFFFKQQ